MKMECEGKDKINGNKDRKRKTRIIMKNKAKKRVYKF